MQVQPYLFFSGNCEAAINFYKDQLGAKITYLSRFKDSPNPEMAPPEWQNKIMHANFTLGDDQLMASDGIGNSGQHQLEGFSLFIGVDTYEEGQRLFDALTLGGTVKMPFQKTFWASGFGMLTDQFGVPWLINCRKPTQKN
ncbi:MAG: VOC family protein [Glaciimonas sp.]|nr:VOC family protein [Glaciimonas sp.]